MRKIKKFKIPIYSYHILQKAKKRKIDLFALGLSDQESAKEFISSLASALEPSTVFDFITTEDELAKMDGPLRGDSGTLGVITLGPAFEAKLKAITDPALFALAETAALVFSETGLKVITELIGQEVTAEGLDLGVPRYVFAYPEPETEEESPAPRSDASVLAACLARLSADKIGVTLNEGAVTPKYSLIFSIPWLAKKKKKSAAGPAVK